MVMLALAKFTTADANPTKNDTYLGQFSFIVALRFFSLLGSTYTMSLVWR